jgi:hypothetical protein
MGPGRGAGDRRVSSWQAPESHAAGARVSGEDAAGEDAPDGSGGGPSEIDNCVDIWHAGHDADVNQFSDCSRHTATSGVVDHAQPPASPPPPPPPPPPPLDPAACGGSLAADAGSSGCGGSIR